MAKIELIFAVDISQGNDEDGGDADDLDDLNESFANVFGDDIEIDWRDDNTVKLTVNGWHTGRKFYPIKEAG